MRVEECGHLKHLLAMQGWLVRALRLTRGLAVQTDYPLKIEFLLKFWRLRSKDRAQKLAEIAALTVSFPRLKQLDFAEAPFPTDRSGLS
jgi:hypothetical protein